MNSGKQGLKHVFVSYSSRDEAQALELVGKLEAAGLTCWIAVRDLVPGEDFSNQIYRGIKTAGAFVVVVSEHANASRFVRMETEMAFDCCPIYPVRIEDVPPEGGLALFLRINQWTDAFGAYAEASLLRLSSHIMLGISHGEMQEGENQGPAVNPVRPARPISQTEAAAQRNAQAFSASSGQGPDTKPEPDDHDMRAFVGQNDAWFAEKWRKMSLANSEISFNVPAFFLGPIYFAYRKMWLWMALGLAAEVSANTALSIAMAEDRAFLLVYTIIVLVAVALFFGLYFNHLYRLNVRENIARIAQEHSDPSLLQDRLRLVGGTAIWAALAVFAGVAAYTAIMDGVEEEIRNSLKGGEDWDAGPADDATAPAPEAADTAADTAAAAADAAGAAADAAMAPSALHPIYVRNGCPHPISLILYTTDEYGTEHLSEAIPINASYSDYARDSAQNKLMTSNYRILLYASSTDNAGLIWKSEVTQSDNQRDYFISAYMKLDSEGDYNLPLSCP